MLMFTFSDNALGTGMGILAMAAAMEELSKTHKTLKDLGPIALIHWAPQQGKGTMEIIRPEHGTETLQMPFWKGKSKRESLAIAIKLPAVVRLRPENGAGTTLNITASGAHTIIPGADALAGEVLPNNDKDTPLQLTAKKWLREGRVGSSSYALCVGITGVEDPHRDAPENSDIPWDASDFARCAMFFKAVPEAREHLDRMRDQGPLWNALVSAWGELETLHENGQLASIGDLVHRAVDPILAQQRQTSDLDTNDDEPDHPAGPRVAPRGGR